MSQMGQSRLNRAVRMMSAMPPIATAIADMPERFLGLGAEHFRPAQSLRRRSALKE